MIGPRGGSRQKDALTEIARLRANHKPVTRPKRPSWLVCNHDNMTWPCDTMRAMDAWEEIHTTGVTLIRTHA